MANSISKQNILFIVEGSRSEPRLINRMQQVFSIDNNYNVYAYSTAIYKLYDELKADEYLDIVLLLKELAIEATEKQLFSRKFSKIYLLFDFDPHHQKSINELDTYDIDSSCSIALLEKQYNAYLNNALPVINTSVLHLIDLKQNKFLKSLVKHQIKF